MDGEQRQMDQTAGRRQSRRDPYAVDQGLDYHQFASQKIR